jgi:hypothetical protein
MVPRYLLNDELCTFLKRSAHYRGEKSIDPTYCGMPSHVRLIAPITGDVYYMCKVHWDHRAQSVAVDQRFHIEQMNGTSKPA